MSISLCMIAKNEEKVIGNCLKSAVDLVDEIILVDTGSTDKTIEIAQDFDAKIYNYKWNDNFSIPRNISIAKASCDWILILDCDEEIIVPNISDIKYILKTNPQFKGYNLNLVNVINNSFAANFSSLRLFKNHEGFEYQNPIHEQILPSITTKYDTNCIGSLPITIFHYGYSDEIILEKNKSDRNIKILNSMDSKDAYMWMMLGNEYLCKNNFIEAIKNYENSIRLDDSFSTDYSIMLAVNYIASLINLSQYDKALNLIHFVQKRIPNFKDLYFQEFWILFHMSQFDLALIKLDKYISILNDNSYIAFKKYENSYNLNDLRTTTLSKISSI